MGHPHNFFVSSWSAISFQGIYGNWVPGFYCACAIWHSQHKYGTPVSHCGGMMAIEWWPGWPQHIMHLSVRASTAVDQHGHA